MKLRVRVCARAAAGVTEDEIATKRDGEKEMAVNDSTNDLRRCSDGHARSLSTDIHLTIKNILPFDS